MGDFPSLSSAQCTACGLTRRRIASSPRTQCEVSGATARVFHDVSPVGELADGTTMIVKDDQVEIDFDRGVVIHNGNEYRFSALSVEALAILNDGELIQRVKKALART